MNKNSKMTRKDLGEKFRKIADMDEWLKQKEAADREFHKKPWWIQEIEEGDYHYSDGDMDWEEYLKDRE